MFDYVWCSIRRRRAASLVTAGISVMLVILLNLYFGSIRSYQTQLVDLSKNMPVYCRILNRNGSLDNNLFISERTLEGLRQSDQVKDLAYITFFAAGEGDFNLAELKVKLNISGAGANRAEAIGDQVYDLIEMEAADIDEFLSSDRMECIADKTMMRRRKWEIGDTVVLKCYYDRADSEFGKREFAPMGGTIEVKIVGTMSDIRGKNGLRIDVLLPYDGVLRMYDQYGHPCFADSASFYVKDSLQLNEFKEQMLEIGLGEKISTAMDSYHGCVLEVKDNDFITSATNLRRSIEMLQMSFPVVCALVLMIGYVVSYLSGNSRKEEFALLRLQGVKKMNSSLLFLSEQMMLVLAGNLIGDAVMVFAAPSVSLMFAVNGILILAYLIGSAAAYGRMSRGSVVALLSAQQ